MTLETSKDLGELLGAIPRRVVIVDDEKVVLRALERAFFDAGVKEVMAFEDGTSAGRIIASGAAVDAFILDWRLPDFGGLALLNRIREQTVYDRTPVLVLSGFLEKRDFRLAAEFPLLALVEKPSHANYVFKKLGELFRERDFFDVEGQSLDLAINELVPRDNFIDKGWETIRSRLRDAPRPAPVYFIAIRLLQRRGLSQFADILLQDLLAVDAECAPAWIEMGKKKIADGNYISAAKCLQRAAALAPRNLERLCLLGDTQIRMLRGAEAKKTFTDASDVDPVDERVVSGLRIASNMERHVGVIDLAKMQGNLTAMLNAIGVVMVRQGNLEEGVYHYRAALRYAANDPDWMKLGFNLGLAYMRWQKPVEASIWFKRAWVRSKGSFKKAKRYFDQTFLEVRRLGLRLDDHEADHGGETKGGVAGYDGSGPRPLEGFVATTAEINPSGLAPEPSVPSGPSEQKTILPPAEYPPDLLAWDKIRKVLRTVRIPDRDLFGAAGAWAFSRDHLAYGGLIGERSVCILIPKSVAVNQVPHMEEAEAQAAGVKALRRTRKVWSLMWPLDA